MDSKRKLAAVGLAAVIGVAGYGVYATTVNAASASASTCIAAGATAQGQVVGVGTVTINAGQPVYDPATGLYEFKDLAITPIGQSAWHSVQGKTIEVEGYSQQGTEVVSGSLQVPAQGSAVVPLNAGDANAIVSWRIVVK